MPRAVISKARNSDLRSPSRPPRMLSLPTVRAGGCAGAVPRAGKLPGERGGGLGAALPGLGAARPR